VAIGGANIVAALLLARADPHVRSPVGQTAEEMTDDDCLTSLLQLFGNKLSHGDLLARKAIARLSVKLQTQVNTHLQEEPGPDAEALLDYVRYGDVGKVVNVLKRGADPNARDSVGETPLFDAVASGNADIVAALLLHRADPLVQSPSSGDTAREMAESEAMLALLSVFDGSADPASTQVALSCLSEPFSGEVAVHLQSCESTAAKKATAVLAEKLRNDVMCEEVQCVTEWLRQGADPSTTNLVGEPLLFEAALSDSRDIVGLLLAHRADPTLHAPGRPLGERLPLDVARSPQVRSLLRLFQGQQISSKDRADALNCLDEDVRRCVGVALRQIRKA